jgi:hypothetical protein
MGLNPFEDFPVTFAGCQFLQQGIGIEAKKLHQALVGWGIVYIFAILPGEGSPALVEHTCQNHVVAQANAKAPGRALSQINKVMLRFHNSLVLIKPGWSKSEITPSLVGCRSRRSWINLLDVGSSNRGNGGKETELFGRILRRIAYDRHGQAAASGSVALVLPR